MTEITPQPYMAFMLPPEQVVCAIAAILVVSRTTLGGSYDQNGVAEEAWDLYTAVHNEYKKRMGADNGESEGDQSSEGGGAERVQGLGGSEEEDSGA